MKSKIMKKSSSLDRLSEQHTTTTSGGSGAELSSSSPHSPSELRTGATTAAASLSHSISISNSGSHSNALPNPPPSNSVDVTSSLAGGNLSMKSSANSSMSNSRAGLRRKVGVSFLFEFSY
jgi:hypothetical protein